MAVKWSGARVIGAGSTRSWAALACPNCASMTLVEVRIDSTPSLTQAEVLDRYEITEIRVVPSNGAAIATVKHLPADVEKFFLSANRVLAAGEPDAAAVQLRKTLEAAAAQKGVTEKTLYKSVEKLIEQGMITTDFSKLLDHVRKIGNMGAHYTDEELGQTEVERSLRFTTQVLRNLFEVPGELAELERADDPAATPVAKPVST